MDFWRSNDSSSIIQLALIIVGVITGLIIVIIGLIMTFKYAPWRQPQPLILKLQSLSVTNLNISSSLSDATWNAKLFLANQNSVLEIFIDKFETLLYYNHSNRLDPISCSVVEAVHLWPRRQKLVEARYNSRECEGEQPFVEENMAEEMKKDGEKGGFYLFLGLEFRVKYRTGILYWDYELKPKCPHLEMQFVAVTGVGWLTGDEPRECLVQLP